MKIRNVVYDNKSKTNKVVWFGSIGTDANGLSIKADNHVEVKSLNIEAIKEYKRIEVINSLSVLKGELKHNKRFGISLLDKTTKELLDIEVLDILRSQLSLVVLSFQSKQEGRDYRLEFQATTPEGVQLDISYNYNFEY